ncbi:MAG TPA: cytochrome c oxidase subunit II [Pirellulales bacterium]|jgi:cytochrome c oxidase subunit 2|nr:cytochrome c oxidase subunit II [Pirellulales bacterium]
MTTDVAIFPRQASVGAYEVDLLLAFLSIVCGSVGLLVAGLLIFFSVYYRRRPGDTATPPETPSSHALEWFWTLTPSAIFVVMFLWGAKVYLEAFRAPADAMPIFVVAKQWMWKFQHPEGQREINTLHVPVGQRVKLLLTSEDVIHSFFVPEFRVHMDVLPDRYTSVCFEPTEPGDYHLFCSQYCGTNHAGMIGTVTVMEPGDYADWLSQRAEGSLALEGRKVFLKYRCISCHSADENARAPVLEALAGRPVHLSDGSTVTADENYLRESILNPGAKVVAGYQAIMPTFRGQIGAEEINAVLAWLGSLERGQTPTRVEDYSPPATTPAITPEPKQP